MPDNPQMVALLAYFAQERTVTRPEIAEELLGNTVGFVAGIHHRNEKKIGTWPKLDPLRRKNRKCQFPMGNPLHEGFRLCDCERDKDDLVCNAHIGKVWSPT